MAKKKTLKKFRKRAAARRAPSSAPRANPPFFTDMLYEVGPAFGAYAAGRVVGRMAMKLGGAKMGIHAAPVATTVLAAAAWFAAHRIPKIAKFHTPIIVGTSIAALQTIAHAYLPKYAWLVGDAKPEDYQMGSPAAQAGLGGMPHRRRRRKGHPKLAPVGDEFDAMEQQAHRHVSVTEDEFDQAEPGEASESPAESFEPDEWELDAGGIAPDEGDVNEEDYGSLAGGMSN